jgi:hypothetical protein
LAENGTTPTIFGVASTTVAYSPTYDNGANNGYFIRDFLTDADNDQVEDTGDNCSPRSERCEGTNCFNPNQDDADSDGIGDACDNCPPALCVRRNVASSFCSNPGQEDVFDGDRVGDICDTCPTQFNPQQNATMDEPDPDADGVGSRCDNCEQRNPPLACRADSDCTSSPKDPRCISQPRLFGQCQVSGRACMGNFACNAGEFCLGVGTWGRCVAQPDPDQDEIGAPCDSCPNDWNATLQSNSNDVAEVREGVAALADICDPVPNFVTKALTAPGFQTQPYNPNDVTVMRASAQIGNPVPVANASVGFRYCDCHQTTPTEVDLDQSACLVSRCSRDPAQFNLPDGSTAWARITVGSNGPGNVTNFALPTGARNDISFQRSFTSVRTRVDGAPFAVTPEDRFEVERIGNLENLFWFHRQDVNAGRVPAFAGGAKTTGLFWSHATYVSATHSRDSSVSGRLRDSYEYIRTPATHVAIPRQPGFGSNPCTAQACRPSYRGDLVNERAVDLVFDVNPFKAVPSYAYLARQPDASVIAVSTHGNFDVTNALSPGIRAALASSNMMWLTPVEAGSRGSQTPQRDVQFSVMPRNWTQATAQPLLVVRTSSGVTTTAELGELEFDLSPEATLVPSDRTDVGGAFSSTELAVYMVGGVRSGKPTGDVWRYDFRGAVWEKLAFNRSQEPIGGDTPSNPFPNAVKPGKVLSTAYNDLGKRLVTLDEVQPFGLRFVRMMVHDLKTRQATFAATIPRTGVFETIQVVAQENGTFILLASNPLQWTAFEFATTAAGGIQWLRKATGIGRAFDTPVNATGGIVFPAVVLGFPAVVNLSYAIFVPWPQGCTQL